MLDGGVPGIRRDSSETFRGLTNRMILDQHKILSIFHILFVVPLFFAIAFFKSSMPEWAYQTVLGLGVFLFVYQGYKAMGRWSQSSSYLWVNLIHVAFVAPLLIYIGYTQKNTPRFAYELCIMVGFAALGYHMYSLIQSLNIVRIDDD